MTVVHFYHAYAAGEWRDPVAEHMAALEDGGFDGEFHVGVVGPPEQRADVLEELRLLRLPDSVTEADDGWEQVTLKPLHAFAHKHDGVILYAHTKGAAFPHSFNITWRRAMSWHVVRNWREHIGAIGGADGYDVVGCHWLTPQQFPGLVSTPFFGGTYWMASTEYLRKLPECALESRHDAEVWIGLAHPRVLDLSPGWPGSYTSALPYRRLVARRA